MFIRHDHGATTRKMEEGLESKKTGMQPGSQSERERTTESQRIKTLLHYRSTYDHFCFPSSLFYRLTEIIFSIFMQDIR